MGVCAKTLFMTLLVCMPLVSQYVRMLLPVRGLLLVNANVHWFAACVW